MNSIFKYLSIATILFFQLDAHSATISYFQGSITAFAQKKPKDLIIDLPAGGLNLTVPVNSPWGQCIGFSGYTEPDQNFVINISGGTPPYTARFFDNYRVEWVDSLNNNGSSCSVSQSGSSSINFQCQFSKGAGWSGGQSILNAYLQITDSKGISSAPPKNLGTDFNFTYSCTP